MSNVLQGHISSLEAATCHISSLEADTCISPHWKLACAISLHWKLARAISLRVCLDIFVNNLQSVGTSLLKLITDQRWRKVFWNMGTRLEGGSSETVLETCMTLACSALFHYMSLQYRDVVMPFHFTLPGVLHKKTASQF